MSSRSGIPAFRDARSLRVDTGKSRPDSIPLFTPKSFPSPGTGRRICTKVSDGNDIGCDQLELLDKLGSGVTSTVFRALFKGSFVAVKELDCDPFQVGAEGMKTLHREVSILKSISHPHLVKLIGTAQCETKLQMVMELCEGGDVFTLLYSREEVELSWMQTLTMGIHVAEAMDYLHSLTPSIIHRDLKSLNLLLKQLVHSQHDTCDVKVADFGNSRTLEVLGPETPNTQGRGTFNWMAPEVFTSNSYDTSADVYSFGMVLYELITRELPFEDIDQTRIGFLVFNGERPDLEAVPPQCPRALEELMIECWAGSPGKRPGFAVIVNSLHRIREHLSGASKTTVTI